MSKFLGTILLVLVTLSISGQVPFIDKEQERIDELDGKVDQHIKMDNNNRSLRANTIYFTLVDSLTEEIASNVDFDESERNRYHTALYKMLKGINEKNIDLLNHFEQLFSHTIAILHARESGNLLPLLEENLFVSLKTVSFYKHEDEAEVFLSYASERHPDEVLKVFGDFAERPYAQNIVVQCAKVAPASVKKYLLGSNAIKEVLLRSEDPIVQDILQIQNDFGSTSCAFSLIDAIASDKLTISEANELGNNDRKYLQELIEIRKEEDPIGEHSLDAALLYASLDYVRVLNEMHLEKNPKVRFASIEDFTPEELYTLIVYTHEEIFTSTFLGLFNRMVTRLDTVPGDEFMASMGWNRFRTFIKVCAGYNMLNDFLATMDYDSVERLLQKFAGGLDESGDLSQAVDVADTFGSIEDTTIIAILERTIRSEYERVLEEEDFKGQAIYGLLSAMFVDKAMYNEGWFAELAMEYQLPSIDKVKARTLFNRERNNVQMHYFYDDPDGYSSFAAFTSTFKTDEWVITDEEYWITITSSHGHDVTIYANKPKFERPGHDEINKYFEEQGISPSIVIHRGHSYYVPLTIKRIPASAKIVVLGSCGGYHNLTSVLERSSDVHIISSKQIGTMFVNNPLAYQMSEYLRMGKDIVWPVFWEELQDKVKDNQKAREKFDDYIPPHQNLGAIFVQAYRQLINS